MRPGDTLFAIAKRYAVTVRQIQYHNNIINPHALTVNSRLRIPNKDLRVPSHFLRKPEFIWPLKRLDISSGFGARRGQHTGVDLRAPRGTPIRAAAAGTVVFSGSKRGYGNTIIIQHDNAIKTLYAHTLKNLVVKGQRVSQGSTIATVGKSGNATGYHVHFEYHRYGKVVNPLNYLPR